METSFSYDNFPHLWDAIIGYATPRARQTIRLLSRAHRYAVNRFHLVLVPGMSTWALVSGLWGPAPELQAMLQALLSPANCKDFALLRSRIPTTKVLELRGFVMPSVDLRRLRPALPNVEIVRICNEPGIRTFTPYIPLEAETLVLFMNMSGWAADGRNPNIMQIVDLTQQPRFFGEDEEEKPLVVPRSARLEFPESYRKLVVNMNGYAASAYHLFPFLRNPPAELEEVVIVGPRYRDLTHSGTTSCPPSSFGPEAAADWKTVYFRAVQRLVRWELVRKLSRWEYNSKVRFTLVGFEDVPPVGEVPARDDLMMTICNSIKFRAQPNVDYDIDDQYTMAMSLELRGKLKQEAARARGDKGTRTRYTGPFVSLERKMIEARSRIEFVTRRQYVKRVGPQRARLELIEYGSKGDYPDGVAEMVEGHEKRQKRHNAHRAAWRAARHVDMYQNQSQSLVG